LFYRALLARAFFDTDKGPQEFAYLPDDLLPMVLSNFPEELPVPAQPAGRRARPAERGHILPATDRILDDATTLLAAIRVGQAPPLDGVLQGLLSEAGLLTKKALQAKTVKTFLESPRTEALNMLVDAWRTSLSFNELRLIPGLICEGEWINDPLPTRQFVLNLLSAIPKGTWWSLDSFVAAVKASYPDFERPAGDYDSWFIRSTDQGRYLRGFADWEAVDGALIRFLITGVMHRLGMLDLASPADGMEPTSFRIPDMRTRASGFPTAENGKLHIATGGAITAPRPVPRAVRYQLARFCEWDHDRPDEYRYHVTSQSLTRAAEQGLKVEQMLALLTKHADAGLPPVFMRALKRWQANGTEARVVTQAVLRVSRPEILAQIRKSKAARFLGEPLGPAAAVIKPGAQSRVVAALAELGLLAQDDTDPAAASGMPAGPSAPGAKKS
jgi:hypothetical protein